MLINPYVFALALNPGDPYGGGYFAGYISHTSNGVPTHALIVAPRATGASGTGYPVTTLYAWKTSQTSTAGTGSTFDGAANTAAMVLAGIANHPAAGFCVGLSIGGFTDWYLPARYEMEIAYFNFKPFSIANTTSFGANPYSVPLRNSNYTSNVPGLTSSLIFRSAGSERFEAGLHYVSTETTAANGSIFNFANGSVTAGVKTNGQRIRAFRRIAL